MSASPLPTNAAEVLRAAASRITSGFKTTLTAFFLSNASLTWDDVGDKIQQSKVNDYGSISVLAAMIEHDPTLLTTGDNKHLPTSISTLGFTTNLIPVIKAINMRHDDSVFTGALSHTVTDATTHVVKITNASIVAAAKVINAGAAATGTSTTVTSTTATATTATATILITTTPFTAAPATGTPPTLCTTELNAAKLDRNTDAESINEADNELYKNIIDIMNDKPTRNVEIMTFCVGETKKIADAEGRITAADIKFATCTGPARDNYDDAKRETEAAIAIYKPKLNAICTAATNLIAAEAGLLPVTPTVSGAYDLIIAPYLASLVKPATASTVTAADKAKAKEQIIKLTAQINDLAKLFRDIGQSGGGGKFLIKNEDKIKKLAQNTEYMTNLIVADAQRNYKLKQKMNQFSQQANIVAEQLRLSQSGGNLDTLENNVQKLCANFDKLNANMVQRIRQHGGAPGDTIDGKGGLTVVQANKTITGSPLHTSIPGGVQSTITVTLGTNVQIFLPITTYEDVKKVTGAKTYYNVDVKVRSIVEIDPAVNPIVTAAAAAPTTLIPAAAKFYVNVADYPGVVVS